MTSRVEKKALTGDENLMADIPELDDKFAQVLAARIIEPTAKEVCAELIRLSRYYPGKLVHKSLMLFSLRQTECIISQFIYRVQAMNPPTKQMMNMILQFRLR